MLQFIFKLTGCLVTLATLATVALFIYISTSSEYSKRNLDRKSAYNVDRGGEIRLEMDQKEVLKAAGEPREIIHEGGRDFLFDVWHYEHRDVMFTNGYVTSVKANAR